MLQFYRVVVWRQQNSILLATQAFPDGKLPTQTTILEAYRRQNNKKLYEPCQLLYLSIQVMGAIFA